MSDSEPVVPRDEHRPLRERIARVIADGAAFGRWPDDGPLDISARALASADALIADGYCPRIESRDLTVLEDALRQMDLARQGEYTWEDVIEVVRAWGGYCPPPLPAGMTAEKLREIAAWMDTHDELGDAYIALLDSLAERGVETNTTAVDRVVARDALHGNGVQDDLRAWADEIGARGLLVTAPESEFRNIESLLTYCAQRANLDPAQEDAVTSAIALLDRWALQSQSAGLLATPPPTPTEEPK